MYSLDSYGLGRKLVDDFYRIVKSWATSHDLRSDDDISDSRFTIRILTFLRKIGNKNHKKIHWAKGYKVPGKLKNRVNALVKLLKNGEYVGAYLSRKAFNLSENPDGLHSDWNIVHFHLGKIKDKNDKLSQRTSELLYCIMGRDDVYIIGIWSHKESVWARQEIVQVVYDNWPKLFRDLMIDDMEEIDNEKRKIIRKAKMVTPVCVIDKSTEKRKYLLSNTLSMASSGDPVIDVCCHDDICNMLQTWAINFYNTPHSYFRECFDRRCNVDVIEDIELLYQNGMWRIVSHSLKRDLWSGNLVDLHNF